MTEQLPSRKVCMVGLPSVGKTSLVRRFVYDVFDDAYLSTIGVKVSRKTVKLPQAELPAALHLVLWDLAGDSELRPSYLRGMAGAILVYDVTRPDTLAALPGYADTIAALAPEARIIVAANKSDQCDPAQLPVLPADLLRIPSYSTSAKTGAGVAKMFRQLAISLL